jgi:hypothetical protein
LTHKGQPRNVIKKKLQVKAIPNAIIKNTFWPIWIADIPVPTYLDADIIDKYFAQEVKDEKKKLAARDSVVIEEKKQVVLFDDKRSRNLSILLSRYSISSNEMHRILDKFDTKILQNSILYLIIQQTR